MAKKLGILGALLQDELKKKRNAIVPQYIDEGQGSKKSVSSNEKECQTIALKSQFRSIVETFSPIYQTVLTRYAIRGVVDSHDIQALARQEPIDLRRRTVRALLLMIKRPKFWDVTLEVFAQNNMVYLRSGLKEDFENAMAEIQKVSIMSNLMNIVG